MTIIARDSRRWTLENSPSGIYGGPSIRSGTTVRVAPESEVTRLEAQLAGAVSNAARLGLALDLAVRDLGGLGIQATRERYEGWAADRLGRLIAANSGAVEALQAIAGEWHDQHGGITRAEYARQALERLGVPTTRGQ